MWLRNAPQAVAPLGKPVLGVWGGQAKGAAQLFTALKWGRRGWSSKWGLAGL